MRLFLDSSVMIAGATWAEGAFRSVFRRADAVAETVRNLGALSVSVTASWLRLRGHVVVVDDVMTIDKHAVFPAEKDQPILFGAWALADILLTLDRADLSRLLGGRFCGLAIMTPGMLPAVETAARAGRKWWRWVVFAAADSMGVSRVVRSPRQSVRRRRRLASWSR